MYQALYRKYRPQTFDEVAGQSAVTVTLKNQVAGGKLSHAYLFTGSRGTGKTSCAKILAKAVNCEQPENGNPCNRCAACKSIDAGACIDVQEIDAASNNGVEYVRDLRDEAVYLPAEVKMRVYIIDEVHMLSLSAFNALLKLIEEPPEHVLFILATTELHKVPATILSRCQRFAFRRLSAKDLTDRLNFIAYREQIDLQPDAADYLARLADGGMRDAVSLLDQCASAAGGAVTLESVYQMLGMAGSGKTAELMQAIAAHDTATALSIFGAQYAEGKDLAAMLDELCTVARDLLLLRTAPKSDMVSGICTAKELNDLHLSAGELLRIASILRDAANGFNTSANRRIDAELAIIRLCEPEAETDLAALNARLSRLEERLAAGIVAAIPSSAAPTQQRIAPDSASEPGSAAFAENKPSAAPIPVASAENKPLNAPQTAAPVQKPPAPMPDGFWIKLLERLKTALPPYLYGAFVGGKDAPVQGETENDTLHLLVQNDWMYERLNTPETLHTVAQCAAVLLGRAIAVDIRKPKEQKNDGFARLLSRAEQEPSVFDII